LKKLSTFLVLAAVFVFAACADKTVSGPDSAVSTLSVRANANGSSGLTLHPSGFGPHALAAWRANEGEQDSRGNADQALYFQKFTATETFAAGIAVIKGLEGAPISALTGLEWQHRIDGWCGAGAPRWDLFLDDAAGNHYTVFLGCAAAAHSPGDEAGWLRDTYGLAAITTALPGVDPAGLTIGGLQIVFDEGTTQFDLPLGPGQTWLDNIVVNGHVWTSPADNGAN
jgi:hypothetical protein